MMIDANIYYHRAKQECDKAESLLRSLQHFIAAGAAELILETLPDLRRAVAEIQWNIDTADIVQQHITAWQRMIDKGVPQ